MGKFIDDLRAGTVAWYPRRPLLTGGLIALTTLGVASPGYAQSSTPALVPATHQTAQASKQESDVASQNPTVGTGAFTLQAVKGEVSEDQLKQLLVGKTLYLRAGYQDNNLEFDQWGRLVGHSLTGSYTLSQIQVNKVKLTKHKLELQGDRYALHFLGAAPYEDPTKATDRVKITPKKKTVRISFDRVEVEKPKKEKDKDKDKKKEKNKHSGKAAAPKSTQSTAKSQPQPAPAEQPAPQPPAPSISSGDEPKTTSPAVSSGMLLTALDKVFSRGIDDRLIAAMPDFWKLYFKAAEAKQDFKPDVPGVYRESNVDQKAKLVSVLDPPSNAFAQANGVAGIALYHAIVGSDGKVQQVVVGRPIGFGLDENAEQTIQKAVFQPAMKDGKPVPVALDLVVSFRIYSKRTSQPDTQADSDKPEQPVLPGPYSVLDQTQPSQQSQAPQQSSPTGSSEAPH